MILVVALPPRKITVLLLLFVSLLCDNALSPLFIGDGFVVISSSDISNMLDLPWKDRIAIKNDVRVMMMGFSGFVCFLGKCGRSSHQSSDRSWEIL